MKKNWAKYPSCEAYEGLLDAYSVKSEIKDSTTIDDIFFIQNSLVYFFIMFNKCTTNTTKLSDDARTKY